MLISVAVILGSALLPQSSDLVVFVRAIELPSVEGRIDHLALDPSGQRLFVAALGNNTVEVLDVKSDRHLKGLRGFHEPQGIGFAADVNAIVVANGQGDGIQIVEGHNYGLTQSTRLGDDSDNVRYDAAAKTIYVGYGDGALAAIAPGGWCVNATVRLQGHPESFQLERTGRRIFVNVPAAEQIAVVDRAAMKVIATWPVTNARANYPMALDEAHHRVFVGCRKPAKVLAFDTTTGKQIGSADIVGDTDDMFFDARRNRLYVVGGAGYIDVLDTSPSGSPTRLARVEGAPGARTALFTPDQDRLYLAVPHRGAQRSQIRVFEMRD